MKRAAALALVLAACGGDTRPKAAPGPSVRVTVAWPGAGPEHVEADVVEPVERVLRAVPGVTQLRSATRHGLTTIEVTGSSVEAVQAALAPTLATLPPGAEHPTVERLDPRAIRALVALPLDARRAPLDQGDVFGVLAPVAGVRVRERCGGASAEVRITVDPSRLEPRGVVLLDVADALARAGVDLPAGRVATGASDRVVNVRSRLRTLDELGALVVREGVLLRDLAMIERTAASGCQATVDGVPGAIAVIERPRRVTLPDGVRLLDGAAIEGVLAVPAAQVATVIAATHAAVGAPRWLATRFDPDLEELTVSIGLAPGDRGTDVADAVDHAVGSMVQLAPARWHGSGLVTAEALVRGPDARAAGPRLAAELRAAPGVAGAGCAPCGNQKVDRVNVHTQRLAAVGAPANSVARVVAIAETGLEVATFDDGRDALPVRLTVPPDADVRALAIRTDDGAIALGELLTVVEGESPGLALRVDGQPAIELWARGKAGTSPATLRALVAGKAGAARP